MSSRASVPSVPQGLMSTVLAGICAGALCGLLFGALDGIIALSVGNVSIGFFAALGCLAASVSLYSLLGMIALGVAALILAPLIVRKRAGQRFERLLAIGLALGCACEIYWWTRPYVFYGRSSISPERLASSAAIFVASIWIGAFVARHLASRMSAVVRPVYCGLCVCWLGGTAFLTLQANAVGTKGSIQDRNRDLPNVLLIVVDALRQDVLGCYGHPRVKTPELDRLAADGVLFENAFVQAPFTWTSFGSLLTGKYPRRHGLVKMKTGVRMVENATLPWHLKHARTKSGVELQDEDWLAATFHTGTLTASSGLLYGFDMRFEATAGHELVVLDQAWSVFRSDLLLYILKNKITQRFDSGIVASEAKKWLAEHGRGRFVAMVHLYSTHTPYDAPAEFKRMYVDPAYEGPMRTFYAHHREAIEHGDLVPTAADIEQIRNLYYAGVSQADDLIGEIVAELERIGVREHTLVIVTSDHGESLGEHGLWEHNHMVQTNLRVPMIMSWPGKDGAGLPRGVRVKARVDEIDVLPTVCDLLRIEPPPETDKYSKVDGVSLVPWIRGASGDPRPYSFAENGTHLSVQDGAAKLIVRHEHLEFDTLAAALARPGDRPRLYDVEHDRAEDHDLIDQRPDVGAALFDALKKWDGALPIPRSALVKSSRDLENEDLMRKFGYTEGGIGAGSPEDH